MRFVAARVVYADSFGWAFARRMAGRTACAAHSIRTRAALLAMPRLRAQRSKVRAVFLVGSMRVRSAVNKVWLVGCKYSHDAVSPKFTQRPCLDIRFQALIVPFEIHLAFAFRAPVLRACEAASILMI